MDTRAALRSAFGVLRNRVFARLYLAPASSNASRATATHTRASPRRWVVCARYRRAAARRPIRAQAAHFANRRGRPGTTIVYMMPIRVTASANETNRILVTYTPASDIYTITDSAANLTSSGLCMAVDSHTVNCPGTGIKTIDVDVGRANDSAELDRNTIQVSATMETSIPGVFAAGDIASYTGKLELIATGFSEAAIAVNHAVHHIDPKARVNPGHSTNLKIFKDREAARSAAAAGE
jgi:hypothetical protein